MDLSPAGRQQNISDSSSSTSIGSGSNALINLPKGVLDILKKMLKDDQVSTLNLHLTCEQVYESLLDQPRHTVTRARFGIRGSVPTPNYSSFNFFDGKRFPNVQKIEIGIPNPEGDINNNIIALNPSYSNLKNLTLRNCGKLTNLILRRVLKSTPQLKELELLGCQLTQSTFSQMAFKNICSIKFSMIHECPRIDFEVFRDFLKNSPHLEKLHIKACNIDGLFTKNEGIADQRLQLPNLKELIWNTLFVMDGMWIFQAGSEIKKLEINSCLDIDLIGQIATTALSKLEDLRIEGNWNNDHFCAFVRSSKGLKVIDNSCPEISSSAWMNINLSQLHSLSFSLKDHEYKIHSNIIAELVKTAPLLQELRILSCDISVNACSEDPQTPEQFESLEGALKNLRYLFLGFSNLWSDNKVINLIKRSRNLQIIGLRHFQNITEDLGDYLVDHFPALRFVNVFETSIPSSIAESLRVTMIKRLKRDSNFDISSSLAAASNH